MAAIEGVGRPGATRAPARANAANRVAFPPPDETAEPGVAASAAPVPAAALASMLALQELGREAPEDRAARRHGLDLLAALAGLQRALLAGRTDPAVLQNLMELAASVPRAADPRLTAMLSAIVVRARVELARRQA